MALETLASTSVLLVDSAASPQSDIVLLSSFTQGFPLTVRDIGGNLTTKEIIISTTTNSHFIQGPLISSFTINEAYGSLTFYPRLSNVWELLNTFAFPLFSNLQANSLSTSIANFGYAEASIISSSQTRISSGSVASPPFTLSTLLTVSALNTKKFLKNQVSIFEQSDPSTFFTSSLIIEGQSPYITIPALTIGSNISFYTSSPTVAIQTKNTFLSLDNYIQLNSSLTVSSFVTGINLTRPREALDISGNLRANLFQQKTIFDTGPSTSLLEISSSKLFLGGTLYDQETNLNVLTISSLTVSKGNTIGASLQTSTLLNGLFSTLGNINIGGSLNTSTIQLLSTINTTLAVQNTTGTLLVNGQIFQPAGKLTESVSTLQISSLQNIFSPFSNHSYTVPFESPFSIVLPTGDNTNVPGSGGSGSPQNTFLLVVPGGEYKYSLNNSQSFNDTTGIPFNSYAASVLWTGTFWLTATYDLATNTKIYKSIDGITWSTVTPSGSYPDKAIRNFIWTGTEIFAVGDTFTGDSWIASSTDGVSWTPLIGPGALDGGMFSCLEITSGSTAGRIWIGGFNAVAGLLYSDNNGSSYTPATFPGYNGAISRAIATNGSVVVAAYDFTPGLLYTGVTSTTFSNAAFLQSGFDQATEVIYTGTTFAALGWNGGFNVSRLQLSSDGITWSNAASFSTWAKSLCWDGSTLYISGFDVYGSGNTFIYSTSDYVNWVSTIVPTTSETYQLRCTSNAGPSGGRGIGVKVDSLYFKGQRQTQDQLNNMIQISTNFITYNSSLTLTSGAASASQLGIRTNNPSYLVDTQGIVNASSLFVQGQPLNFRNAILQSTINVSTIQPLLNESSFTIFGPVAQSVGGVPNVRIGDFLTLQQSSLTQSVSTSIFSTSSSNLIVQTPFQLTIDSFLTTTNQHTSNLWISVGRDTLSNCVKYSFDGSNWSNTTGATFSGVFEGWAVAYNGRQWLTALNNSSQLGATFFTSSNGISWSQITTSGNRPNTVVQDICWTGSFWIAVGYTSTGNSNNTIARSTDGITWTPATSGGFTPTSGVAGFGVAFNGYRLVAVGFAGGGAASNQSIKYSDNQGLTWLSPIANGFTSVGRGVAWNGRLWVAVGANSTAAGTIKYSFDGITWTNIATNGFSSQGWDVKWNGSIFVAVGQDAAGNTIKFSQDGITWSNASSGAFSSADIGVRVAWNGSYWVAVGTGSTQNNRIKYSFDGNTWFNSANGPHNQQSFGIAYSSNVFPNLQAEQLLFHSRIPTLITSTNQVFSQSSTISFNTALQVNQPSQTSDTIFLGEATRAQNLFVSSIAVGSNAPLAPLDITQPSGTFNYPILRNSVANNTNISTFLTNFPSSNATILPTNSANTLFLYFKDGTNNYRASVTGSVFFTGQHANVPSASITQASIKSLIGCIVRTTDDPPISYRPDGTIVKGKDAIWITETLPQIALTTEEKDPRVWGVISDIDNSDRFLASDEFIPIIPGRIRINGLGEGAIWVINAAGNFRCGDFICSSVVPGLGQRQEDDKVHSYTVAKITTSCDFSLTQDDYICEEFEWQGTVIRKAFVGCVYCCS